MQAAADVASRPRPPEHCADVLNRWMHNDCYCPIGLFWADLPQGDSNVDPDVHNRYPWCSQRGLDVWGNLYSIYAVCAGLGFLALTSWSALQVLCLRQIRTVNVEQQEYIEVVEMAVHAFCFCASAIRLEYLVSEAILVHGAETMKRPLWQSLASMSYTAFYPIACCSFLCICQLWTNSTDRINDSSRPSYSRPLIIACAVFLAVEAIHDILYLLGTSALLEGIYFMYLSLVSVAAALHGLRIARHLSSALSDSSLLYALVNPQAILSETRKNMVCAGLVSASSVGVLLLSIYQALVGRYYPWPCLACWCSGRLLEFAYLAMVISVLRKPSHSTALRSTILSSGSSINVGPPLSFASDCSGPPLEATFSIADPLPGPGSPVARPTRRWSSEVASEAGTPQAEGTSSAG